MLYRVIVKTTVREEYLVVAVSPEQAEAVFNNGFLTKPVVRDVEDAWVHAVMKDDQ